MTVPSTSNATPWQRQLPRSTNSPSGAYRSTRAAGQRAPSGSSNVCSTEGLGACIPSRIRCKPLDDAGHVRFERARNGQVQDGGGRVAAVLEIVDRSTRHENERTLARVDPLGAEQQTHRA